MITESNNIYEAHEGSKEDFTIHVTNPMLYDRLRTLSVEYSLSAELLVNVAVKRLLDDVEFVRGLRAGKTKLE